MTTANFLVRASMIAAILGLSDSGTAQPGEELAPLVGTKLSPPVTITYTGTSPALNIIDDGTSSSGTSPALNIIESGPNRGINVSLTNAKNGYSAIYGVTAGTGSGILGVNSGTIGYGGKFQITNQNSQQPVVYVLNSGSGYGIQVLQQGFNPNAAIYGDSSQGFEGTGVEGNGSYYGVVGTTAGGGTGVHGESNSSTALSDAGFGVSGNSATVAGVFGYNHSSTGPDSSGNFGANGPAAGVYGQSINGYGVYGVSTHSYAGYFNGAGYFDGKLFATGAVSAPAYLITSDRNAKTEVTPIDENQVLTRLSELQIGSWSYKNDPNRMRHVGPMAQDFQAAFHLNGDDDKHINLSDVAGVSLVAIQALNRQLQAKDAEISALKSELRDQKAAIRSELLELEQRLSSRLARVELQRKQVTTQLTTAMHYNSTPAVTLARQ